MSISVKAQTIINQGVGNHPAEAAELIAGADDEVLLEVLAASRQHGNLLDGVVRAIEFERGKRGVLAQMQAFQATAANQIAALRDVESATRDQINVTKSLERKATQLEWVAITLAVLSIGVEAISSRPPGLLHVRGRC